MESESDMRFMGRALELAKRGWGKTTPNPMVGALLVRDGKVIGEGWHTKDGAPHAEIECLRSLRGASAKGATLYVTLEPCSTCGRTGACTRAIIDAEISQVKIGALDPNPAHAGAAIPILEKAGIHCVYGILGEDCSRLNFIFNHIIRKKTPLVALKYAMSADGKIALERGKKCAITSADALTNLMRYRALFGAIAVGYGTLVSDNPRLTARFADSPTICPRRFVFDSSLKLAKCNSPKSFALFSDEYASLTSIVCDSSAIECDISKMADGGFNIVRIGFKKSTPAFWTELKSRLWNDKIYSLFIEGGASVFDSVCKNASADYAFEYCSKKYFGVSALSAFESGKNFTIDGETLNLGEDTLLSGNILWTLKP